MTDYPPIPPSDPNPSGYGQPPQPTAPAYPEQPGQPNGYPAAAPGLGGQFPPVAPKPPRGLAIAALILGIVALVTSAIPFWCYLVILIGAGAVVLGILGVKRKQGGMAITGIILGGLGALIAIVMSIVYTLVFANASSIIDQTQKDLGSETSQGAHDVNAKHDVALTVSGTAKDATVSYMVNDDSGSGTAPTLPWSKSFSAVDSGFYSLSVMAGETSSQITCTVAVDGKTVKTATVEGENAQVDCEYDGITTDPVTEHTVEYDVTGPASLIQYSTDSLGATVTGANKSTWTKTVTESTPGGDFDLSLWASNSDSTAKVTCTLKVDGKVVKTASSDGTGLNTAQCEFKYDPSVQQ